ncbi:hypothetical protein [uncultured Bradyrhizobium sp.]|nr:hypothetical protein [uncultured Bradyrhizobium sp.]
MTKSCADFMARIQLDEDVQIFKMVGIGLIVSFWIAVTFRLI